jgi:hypothetical protein
MTPQEVFEYKNRWMSSGGHPVRLHSDLDWQGKDWCRQNLERYQWRFDSYTAVYQHTFWFENELHAQQFSVEFIDWIEK